MRMKLTLQQLLAFLHLAETRSFSNAALALGISQPSLSWAIRSAERTIGAQLFYRDTRHVELTPVGIELRPIARRIALEFDSEFGELAQFIEGQRGRIAIAALPSIAAIILPRAIARFRQNFPCIEVLIRDCLSAPVIASVMEGAADFGLTIKPEPMPKLSYRPLLTDDFCLVCRSDDPLANGGPVPWSVFREHPFVAMSPASSVRRMTDAAFLQAGLTVKQLFECAHLATTGNLVMAGLGITALPELTLPILGVAGLSVRRLIRPIITRRLGIVTRAGRPLTPACAAFLSELDEGARSVTQGIADVDLRKARDNGR